MFLVDTNVLVYAFAEDVPEHAACRPLLDRWRVQTSPWYTTLAILYEYLRVSTHPRAVRRPRSMVEAVRDVQSLLASPGLSLLTPTDRHGALLAQTVKEIPRLSSNIAHDLATAVLMREHGIRRIVTHDADFQRFPFLEVIDPLREDWPDAVRERPTRSTRRRRRAPARA